MRLKTPNAWSLEVGDDRLVVSRPDINGRLIIYSIEDDPVYEYELSVDHPCASGAIRAEKLHELSAPIDSICAIIEAIHADQRQRE